MKSGWIRKSAGALALAAAGVTLASGAAAQDSFYKGKTMRIIVGFGAGGGFDTYARLIARHLGKHIPGNPNIIVENMTGAGSMLATNYVYKVAKPDGLTIGSFSGTLIMSQLLGQPGIEFDAQKFEWLGMPGVANMVCALTKASGIRTYEQWMAAKTPVKIGGTGRGTIPEDTPKILKEALNLPVQVVSGYKGTADARLAAEKGEVQGICWDWESMRVTWKHAIESGDANVVLQITPRPLPELAKVPLASSLAKSDEAKKLMEVGIQYPGTFTRPYVLPPGTPKDRMAILRQAFQATMKDPGFLADAEKSKLDISPVTAEEAENIVRGLFKIDPAIARRLKDIIL